MDDSTLHLLICLFVNWRVWSFCFTGLCNSPVKFRFGKIQTSRIQILEYWDSDWKAYEKNSDAVHKVDLSN